MSDYDATSDLKKRTDVLRNSLKDFCHHFLAGSSPELLLASCFVPDSPRITEHGPRWAAQKLPYLNTNWAGGGSTGDTCDRYFEAVAATLEFFPDEHTIPPASSFSIDPYNQVGMVVAKCKPQSNATKATWEDQFVFRFSDFDSHGRIGKLEIWFDALAAWDGVTGNSLTQPSSSYR
nr:uncharacterized protein LOC112008222 [Quercus suber]